MDRRQTATGARRCRGNDSPHSRSVARVGTRAPAIAAGRLRAALALAGLWLALAGTAFAAAPKPVAPKPVAPHAKPAETATPAHPMQVVIVTDSRAGCAPDCAQWISAEGRIEPTTPAEFRRVFAALGKRKLPIFISSIGGSVAAAYAIGREIRRRGLDVAVERTVFEKCETASAPCDRRRLKDGDKGRPEPIAAFCISSCVFILAAGTERLAPVYGFVGVHQLHAFNILRRVQRMYQVQRKFENWRIVETRKLVAERELSSTTIEKDPDYAPARAYFTEMGIDTAKIMPLLLGTPNRDVHRLTPEERHATRVVTRVAAGHTLLPAAADAAGVATVAAASAGPAAATTPSDLAGPWARPFGTPKAFGTPKPFPAAAQNGAARADVSMSILVFHPPPEDVVELYLLLKSPSGARVRAAQYAADIQLANGKRLAVVGTGEEALDPLYATLAREDYCALRGAGDLTLKITLTNAARSGWSRRLQFDLAKDKGDAEFAAEHCK